MPTYEIVPMLLGGRWRWTVRWFSPDEQPFWRGLFPDDEAAKAAVLWLVSWEGTLVRPEAPDCEPSGPIA